MNTSQPNADSHDDIWEYVITQKPPERPDGSLASRVTSVDIKLGYTPQLDQFISFVLPDCNANPEGISTVHNQYQETHLTYRAARSYLGNQVNGSFVVWLPDNVWDDSTGRWLNKDSWLTRDRMAVVNALANIRCTTQLYYASTSDSINTTPEHILYSGPDVDKSTPVDGYVNLNDTGKELSHALDERIIQFAQGANAPSGVWFPRFESTGKVGLANSLMEITGNLDTVLIPRFRRINSINELCEFQSQIESSVVVKDPFGTWGTGVVSIGVNQSAIEQIRERECTVRESRDWPEFSLLSDNNEKLIFNSRGEPVRYGIIEEGLVGNISRDNREYNIISVPPETHPSEQRTPIDFVALALAEPDGTICAPSTMFRATGKSGLNGNPQFEYITDTSLEQAMHNEVQIPTSQGDSFSFHLGEYLEQMAGRYVSVDEIESVLFDAATIALAARNLSAFRAEQRLSDAERL